MYVRFCNEETVRAEFKDSLYAEIEAEVREKVASEQTDLRDQNAEQIRMITSILYPPILLQTDGEGRKYHLDYAADSNLQAVLSDVADGYTDQAVQATVVNVADRLYAVRKILKVENDMDPDAKYFVIDWQKSDLVEKIVAAKE
jgi:hypothetical protein